MMHLSLLTLCCVAMVMSMEDTANEKRLVLHSDEDVATAIQTMASELRAFNATVQSLKARDEVIQSLQTRLQVKENTVQLLNNTVQFLQSTVLSMQTTAQTRDTTIQFMQSTMQSMQTATQSTDSTVRTMQTTMASLETNLGQGSTYVRWGRTSCQGNGTTLVYKGFTGGSNHAGAGGAADYICLAQDPLWGYYTNESTNAARVYGAEYHFNGAQSQHMFGGDLYLHDAPCVLCRAPRATSIMIPGRNECYPGWTLEYSGYLVSGRYDHVSATNYACVDTRPEIILGGSPNTGGKLMYVVEAICGTLPCPPYVNYREITCVVCSL